MHPPHQTNMGLVGISKIQNNLAKSNFNFSNQITLEENYVFSTSVCN
jgi:hypothetical protein